MVAIKINKVGAHALHIRRSVVCARASHHITIIFVSLFMILGGASWMNMKVHVRGFFAQFFGR